MKIEKIFKTPLNHWTHKANTTFTDFEYSPSLNEGGSSWNEQEGVISLHAESVNEAHWWGYEVWINMEQKPEDFSLIRKEIKSA
jgi:hypothetical protein